MHGPPKSVVCAPDNEILFNEIDIRADKCPTISLAQSKAVPLHACIINRKGFKDIIHWKMLKESYGCWCKGIACVNESNVGSIRLFEYHQLDHTNITSNPNTNWTDWIRRRVKPPPIILPSDHLCVALPFPITPFRGRRSVRQLALCRVNNLGQT